MCVDKGLGGAVVLTCCMYTSLLSPWFSLCFCFGLAVGSFTFPGRCDHCPKRFIQKVRPILVGSAPPLDAPRLQHPSTRGLRNRLVLLLTRWSLRAHPPPPTTTTHYHPLPPTTITHYHPPLPPTTTHHYHPLMPTTTHYHPPLPPTTAHHHPPLPTTTSARPLTRRTSMSHESTTLQSTPWNISHLLPSLGLIFSPT